MVFCIVYSLWFLLDKPSPTVDYVAELVRELRGHFLDALAEVEAKDRERAAKEVIREFGEPEI